MSHANPIRAWTAHLRVGLTKAEILTLCRGEMPATVTDALCDEARDLVETMRRNGTHLMDDLPEGPKKQDRHPAPSILAPLLGLPFRESDDGNRLARARDDIQTQSAARRARRARAAREGVA